MFVMATRILGSINADSRTIQIILPSPSGCKRIHLIYAINTTIMTISIFILNTKLKGKGINIHVITDGYVFEILFRQVQIST